ncbi:DUF2799 domain-containing protein [Gilvimarinus agarilyticus]|uniref:DUF2799 domain-containing protein n=1 Tax=Gilvimarinus sp. 2_MG-2023 TaxID=3062666 RepID=UPI001C09F396|nr:DUF2799 domain-containing protein [Gilvimarinus sp. 2_MG-2023]MBU2886891.1 DUF2799 domain-containing protein [Gilvimarinus agarilyticus]MDO6571552.1 DUF2799 domain-containing protein [Gilvimarinus sp. 2_MG-2023]
MSSIPRLTLLTSTLLAMTACSTLSKDECLNADWHLIGLEDGSRGYEVSRIGSHREACAKVGVVPNLTHYRAGLNEGYQSYCAAANGYAVGLAGGQYKNVCQNKDAQDFVSAYQHGRDLYRLQQSLQNLNQLIADYNNTIDSLLNDNAVLEEQLVHRARTPTERQQLLNSIKNNEQEAAELAQSIIYSERERAVLAQDLADLEAYHRQLGYQ